MRISLNLSSYGKKGRYNIRYIYVGNLERGEPLQEEKFQNHLHIAFQQGTVTIYQVP